MLGRVDIDSIIVLFGRLLMALGLFIPIAIFLMIAVYVGCFQEEFDKENLNSVWIIVSVVILILLLWAILASFGGGR